MPQFEVTAWRHVSDLVGVRDRFYPVKSNMPLGVRRNACDQVRGTFCIQVVERFDLIYSRLQHGRLEVVFHMLWKLRLQ